MLLEENKSNVILYTIHKYRKYVNKGLLPELLVCPNNDGTHLPLMPQSPEGETVYLCCFTCNYEKAAGLVTADRLASYMRWRDLNPSEPFLT